MKELRVQTATHDYIVSIDERLRFQLSQYISKDYTTIFVITDQTVEKLYLNDVLKGLSAQKTYHYAIDAGEASKNIDQFYQLHTRLMEHHLDRKSLIIALGGGVVGDLAGFVAATYMRGIDYVQVPTTILAHDSSVGGKVAINHPLGKNMIGSFYPPRAVVYDVATLQSLPASEIRSGYAELIKEAYIANGSFLNELLASDLSQLVESDLKDHLYEGIKVKARIVEQDEHEADVRKFLNFGHTLAHALETELGYGTITHGEAVAIGMLFALKMSMKKFATDLLRADFTKWLLHNGYPLSLFDINIERFIQHMKRDKKVTSEQLQMVLLRDIGSPVVVNVTEEEVLQQLKEFEEELNTI